MADQAQNTKQTRVTAPKQQTVGPATAIQGPIALTPTEDLAALQRAVADPGRARPADILTLQRVVGNRAVSHLIQTKLTVGPVGDRYEQEADRVAEQVLSMPITSSPNATGDTGRGPQSVQRQSPEEEEVQTKPLVAAITPLVQPFGGLRVQRQEEEDLQASPLVQPFGGLRVQRQEEEDLQAKPWVQRQDEEEELQASPLVQPFGGLRVQRQEEEELQASPLVQPFGGLRVQRQEEEELQAKPVIQRQADGSFDAGPELEGRLAAHKGGGSSLPDDVRVFMEPRFGADFSGVRVHTSGEAVQMNKDLRAQAFTHGQDIYLGAGRYEPGTTAGKRLLAHELTHVVQQTGGRLQSKAAPSRALGQPVQQQVPMRDGVVQRSWKEDLEAFFKQEKWVGGYESAQTDAGKLPKEALKDLWESTKKSLTPETENWQWYQNLKQRFANWAAKTKGATGWKTFKKRAGSILGTIGTTLAGAFLGPIWKIGKAIYNWKTGKGEENFKDWRHYIALINETKTRVRVTSEPKWLHYVPPVLSLIASVAGDLAGFVGWASLVVGLIGLIPYCQPALGVSGIMGLIALGLTALRALINGSLDGWRNFRLSYLYSLIEDQAGANGVLNRRGRRLASAYQATRGEYEVTKGQYTGDVVGTVIGGLTAGIGGGIGKAIEGKGFGTGFWGGMSPIEQGKGAMEAFGKTQMTQWSMVGESLTGVGTTPFSDYLSGEAGELTGGRIKKEGTAPSRIPEKLKLRRNVTNLNQLLKPPLSTTSGKLRSLMNPITGTWTLLKSAAKILRSVVNGFAWFSGLVKRFRAWVKRKSPEWKQRWQQSTAKRKLEAFGTSVKGAFGRLKPSRWRRGRVQPKLEPSAAPLVHGRLAPTSQVVQRAGEEEAGPGMEAKGTEGAQMDEETKGKLEDFASDNKAERVAKALEDFADVFETARGALEEGAEAESR
jgi:hypothetical protein